MPFDLSVIPPLSLGKNCRVLIWLLTVVLRSKCMRTSPHSQGTEGPNICDNFKETPIHHQSSQLQTVPISWHCVPQVPRISSNLNRQHRKHPSMKSGSARKQPIWSNASVATLKFMPPSLGCTQTAQHAVSTSFTMKITNAYLIAPPRYTSSSSILSRIL